jgi:MoaA/NifB/PqqE/SkfB family radical SAM enzyme
MFKFNELRQIHLEITNNCQAHCPMCSRNHHGGIENPLIKIASWTLLQFQNTINQEVLDQVEALYFCGNFGDPLLNNDLIGMVDYTVNHKPDIGIRIHTNGSLRNVQWWEQLARALPKNHVVLFAIDGLSDTHHLYRIGTDYNQILRNATAFIQAGGIAEWVFIRFKHNAHQVETAKKIAAESGFQKFVMKDSSRFVLDKKFPVLSNQGVVSHFLEPAIESKIVFIDRKVVDNYRQIAASSTIKCYSQQQKEIYIDAFGRLFPCCWLASTPYNYTEDGSEILEVRKTMADQYNDMIEDFGGIDNIDTKYNSVKSIINSTAYQTVWDRYWSDPKMVTCARTCGTNKLSKPIDQFIVNEQL